MAAALPNDLIRVVWKFTNSVGHDCRANMYYQGAGALTQSDLDAYSNELGTVLTPILSTNSHYDGCDFFFGNGTSSPPMGTSTAGFGAGGRGGATQGPQVQFLAKKTTNFSGRHNRGRIYLPDVLITDTADDGTVDSTVVVNHQTQCDHIANDLPTELSSTTVWVMYDAVHGTIGNPIEHLTMERKVATQRRRLKR